MNLEKKTTIELKPKNTGMDKLRTRITELTELKRKAIEAIKDNLQANLKLAKESWPGLVLQGASLLLLIGLAERDALPTNWVPDSFFMDGLFAEPGEVPEELKALAMKDIMFFASAIVGPSITKIFKRLKTNALPQQHE